jgi:hypothetical protein
MVVAAMFEIQVNAIKGQLPSDFDENWYTDKEKYAKFENHKSGSVDPISRWPPPPFWKLKCVL